MVCVDSSQYQPKVTGSILSYIAFTDIHISYSRIFWLGNLSVHLIGKLEPHVVCSFIQFTLRYHLLTILNTNLRLEICDFYLHGLLTFIS